MAGFGPRGSEGSGGSKHRTLAVQKEGNGTVNKPLAGDLRILEPIGPEPDVAHDASPLDFLSAVYRDSRQPMPRRMKAAEAALPFFHPKLAVIATDTMDGLAALLEQMMERRGMRAVIDAPPKALGSE
jgi:hypothetical protein